MEAGIENRSRIISIGTAVPEYKAQQSTILEFMQHAYNNTEASRKLNVLFHNSGIETRHSVVPDFLNQGIRELFPENSEIPFLEKRLDVYKQKALPLALLAIEKVFKNIGISIPEFEITHVITVSCTGLYAPGLDTEIIQKLDLPADTFHTSVNFLGCNAAFPAIKMANSIIMANNGARVLVVCVELCTIHFQPKNNTDNLLSNTLFGDGAAAVLLVSQKFAREKSYNGFDLNNFQSSLHSRGKLLMQWNITQVNFEMILNADVPKFLGSELQSYKEEIAARLNTPFSRVKYWAVHPGGKKILDEVQQQLGLKNDELLHAYKVLKQYGNMSSPTVLFVLAEIFALGLKTGDTVLSMGFGPGISIDAAIMIYENA